jgi:predicted nucleic acid-binding Zn ribbon protein
MARKGNEQSLGDVLKDLLKVYRIEDRMRELDVEEAWRLAMGDVVANKTSELRLRNKVLRIRIESGVMKEEFSYAKEQIVANLNEQLGYEAIEKVEIY